MQEVKNILDHCKLFVTEINIANLIITNAVIVALNSLAAVAQVVTYSVIPRQNLSQ